MPDLSAFPITRRWPAKHPDRLQLYSLPTPNGVKVSIMLEEIGLPYEPHLDRLRQERPADAGIPVAQPERQDPRDHRSGRTRRRAARPLRIRRDPALSRRQDGQAGAGRCGAPLRDHPVGVLPDGLHRTDVRPGRLLPQVRGARDRRQAAARALSRRVRSACSACWRRGSPAGHGSWATTTRSPISPCSAGCATSSASTAPATSSASMP